MDLRDYQKELAEAALQGKNSIVIAPTGSGKTRVAIYVTLQILEAEPNAKVAFLVPTTNLAEQQSEAFKRDLPGCWGKKVCYIHGGKESGERMPFDQAFKKYSVLVVTTQILLNELNRSSKKHAKPTIDVAAFRLIVLDECHSCLESHVSRQVMLKYMQMKHSLLGSEESAQQRKRLPQILGLTASPGTGKADTQDRALDHLVKLCGNLDSIYPVTVQRCRETLDSVTTKPDSIIHPVGRKPNDQFSKLIREVMDRGEELLKGYRDQMPNCDVKSLLGSIPEKGTANYSSFCYTIKYNIHTIDDGSSKNVNACRRYLGCCNKALMISQYFRSKDALTHLEQELRRESEMKVDASCEADMDLRQKLSELMPELLRLCESDRETGVSAPLQKLVEILNSQFAERPDSRAVVFVEEKFYATVLAEYLNETIGSTLPATFVTGGTSSAAEGGTKANLQLSRLKEFKCGKYKVLAATSVIELGVDVPACNLVIRYCHVTNEISMIQCMGRGRAMDSSYHVIVADSQMGLEDKERINWERHAMMLQAVAELTKMDLETRRKRIEEYQTIWMNNAATTVKAPTEHPDARSDAHEVVCNNCRKAFTLSSQLRLIDGKHHVALDENLLTGSLKARSGESMQAGKLFAKVGIDLECSCGIEVAKVVRYKNLFFPLVSIDGVLFKRKDNCQFEKPVNAWKNTAEFLKMTPLSSEESKRWSKNGLKLPAIG